MKYFKPKVDEWYTMFLILSGIISFLSMHVLEGIGFMLVLELQEASLKFEKIAKGEKP
jgi:hypothetical protein